MADRIVPVDLVRADRGPAWSADLARAIHDEALQAVAFCLLEAELCQRVCGSDLPGQIVAELDQLVAGLRSAIDLCRPIVDDLWATAAPGQTARSAADARDQTSIQVQDTLSILDACLQDAELCRRLCLTDQARPGLALLPALLERLELVAETFRGIMRDLRRDDARTIALSRPDSNGRAARSSQPSPIVPTHVPSLLNGAA